MIQDDKAGSIAKSKEVDAKAGGNADRNFPAHYAQCEIGMKRLGTKPLQKLAEFYQMPIDELFEASPRRSASYQIVPTALLQDILTSPAEDVDRAWDYLRHLRKKSSEKGEDDE